MSYKIIGTGSSVPKHIKTNDQLSMMVDTSDEWIRTKTGIQNRRIITKESLSDLATSAAKSALEDSGILPSEVDLIICSTIQGDYITPSLACIVQANLGATCPAFDINAACSGFVYALDVAASYFARGSINNILIVCAEAMSRHLDWQDRETCVLFGDGAGAVVLTKGSELLATKISASGNITMLNIPIGKNSPFETQKMGKSCVKMNGQEVYRFAVSAMKNDIEAVTQRAGLSARDITYILPHQANLRIIKAATMQLGVSMDKVLTNIQQFGNMSSASIAVLLDQANRQNRFQNGDILVLSSFGGGLTTGACVIRWNK